MVARAPCRTTSAPLAHTQEARAARAATLTDVGAHGCARVYGDDHAVLEDEAERGGAVARLDHLHHLALKLVHLCVCVCACVCVCVCVCACVC
jgi:hypothetical protein